MFVLEYYSGNLSSNLLPNTPLSSSNSLHQALYLLIPWQAAVLSDPAGLGAFSFSSCVTLPKLAARSHLPAPRLP